ncbi:MAG: hypothetical protein JXB60_08970 [Candidatus Cloacimonetes bacterium]|nr:hypothetical protein [Candidatus Cloacimonadota bacterium]
MSAKILKSQQGFGLIQTLGVLIIVTIAVVGLFISSVYARYRANENYHYRAALLAAAGKMELIKYYNRGKIEPPNISFSELYLNNTVVLDERGGIPITGHFSYKRKNDKVDLAIANYVVYNEVIVTVTWKEPRDVFIPEKEKILELREDYFRGLPQ